MLNRNLAFIDLESTGLKLSSEIIEMAVILVRPDDFAVLEKWSIKIKPKAIEKADPEALRINHYNEEDWADAVDITVALKIFNEKVKGCVLAGHNVSWDLLWIMNSLQDNGQEKTFYYQLLDTVSLSYVKLSKSLSSFDESYLKLDTLVNYFGIKWDKRHSALSDAQASYEVFVKLVNL